MQKQAYCPVRTVSCMKAVSASPLIIINSIQLLNNIKVSKQGLNQLTYFDFNCSIITYFCSIMDSLPRTRSRPFLFQL